MTRKGRARNMRPGIIEIDIHGMNCFQARVRLDSVLRRADASVYQIIVIHGYHGGEALKDMLRSEYAADPRVKRLKTDGDPGRTTLVLRELV